MHFLRIFLDLTLLHRALSKSNKLIDFYGASMIVFTFINAKCKLSVKKRNFEYSSVS